MNNLFAPVFYGFFSGLIIFLGIAFWNFYRGKDNWITKMFEPPEREEE